MVTCEAIGCRNRSGGKVKMNSFPKDVIRRAQWKKNAGLRNQISDRAALCEVHFATDMWEKVRQDGSKKLKFNAVPTIFGDKIKVKDFESWPALHEIDQNIPSSSVNETNNGFNEPNAGLTLHPIKIILPSKDEQHQNKAETLSIKQVVPSESFNNSNKDSDSGFKDRQTEIHSKNEKLEYNDADTLPSEQMANKEHNSDLMENPVQKVGNKDMLNLHKTCNDKYLSLMKSKIRMQNRHKAIYKKWRKVVTNLRRKLAICESNIPKAIKTVFNDDQFEVLTSRKKPLQWSDETLTKGYKLKFACGSSGYDELINQNIPLPSVRTLCRHLGSWDFESGVLNEVFEFLKIKVSTFEKSIHSDCILTIGEVSITKGKVFDKKTNSFVGYVTLKDEASQEIEYADNFLVFMLAGISQRWKQPVAYYYTNKRTDGRLYNLVMIDILKKSNDILLIVWAVVSDMGAANQAMWATFGIYASRLHIHNKCVNPVNNSRYLYFFQDGLHAFKNFKEGFFSHKTIEIAETFVQQNKLTSNVANYEHIEELLNFQNESEFRLAPKLTEENVRGNSHFRKMRVENTANVLNETVGTALQFLAKERNKPEYETTAWLINIFHKWWKIISYRSLDFALNKMDVSEFLKIKKNLLDFIDIIKTLKVGINPRWKPYQTGLILTTQSTLELSEYLIDFRGYQFVFAARFSQDCLENLFCSLRAKNVTMNALQAKHNLKIICVSAYMKNPSTGSYDTDDREILSGFLKLIADKPKNHKSQVAFQQNLLANVPTLSIPDVSTLNTTESNLLHHLAGYIMRSIIINNKICKNCIILTGNFRPSSRYSKLTQLRSYKEDTLFYVNKSTFNFFQDMEIIFRTYFHAVHSIKDLDLMLFFVKKFSEIKYNLPRCQKHDLKMKIMKRYAVYRLKIKSDKLKKSTCVLSSKSMYMHINSY